MDEQVWITAARRGNLEAFNRLVLENQDSVYTLAYYLVGEEQARQAAQNAVQQAYQRLRDFRNGSFLTWLLAQTVLACRAIGSALPDLQVAHKDHGSLPLQHLPLEARLAVILVDLLKLDCASAAQVAGRTPGEMKGWLANGRVALTAQLAAV